MEDWNRDRMVNFEDTPENRQTLIDWATENRPVRSVSETGVENIDWDAFRRMFAPYYPGRITLPQAIVFTALYGSDWREAVYDKVSERLLFVSKDHHIDVISGFGGGGWVDQHPGNGSEYGNPDTDPGFVWVKKRNN